MSQDFRLLVFFSGICFPQAPEYTIRAVSNFFDNLRRYSQLKVHHWCRWHRWQIEKIFNHKSFNYFVWTPLGSIVTYRYIFAFVSLIPVVHLDLRISPQIFEKIWTGPNGILWGCGETDSWKKTRSRKSRDTVPLISALAELFAHWRWCCHLHLLGTREIYPLFFIKKTSLQIVTHGVRS